MNSLNHLLYLLSSTPFRSQVGRKTYNQDVTGSVDINKIRAGVKRGLLFTVAYAGMEVK